MQQCEASQNMTGKKFMNKILKRILIAGLWVLGSFITLSICLSLLLFIPPVQKYVVSQAANYLTSKTDMKVTVGSVHIGFPKKVNIGSMYIEDLEQDTLMYCSQVSIDADLLPLIRKKLHIDQVSVDGLKGKIKKVAHDSSFNFSPLIHAFGNSSPKESKQSSWEIGFDELTLKNINLTYANDIDSSRIQLLLGSLLIEDNSSDILKQEFDFTSIELGQTSLAMLLGDQQRKAPKIHDTKPSTTIPVSLQLGSFQADDLAFDLNFTSGKLGLSASLGHANLQPKNIDLQSQSIVLNELLAEEIDVSLTIKPTSQDQELIEEEPKPVDDSLLDYTFGNFDWNFLIDHAEVSRASYKMDLDEAPRNPEGMDYAHMHFTDFSVVADSLHFNKHRAGANVSTLSGKEISGAEIHTVKGSFSMDNQHIIARDIFMKTTQSQAAGSIVLRYPALHLIGKEIAQFGIETNLQGKIYLAEIRPFTNILDTYPLLKKIESISIKQFETSGSLGDLRLRNAEISMNNSTFLKASGSIQGLPSTNLRLDYQLDTLITSRTDLITVLPDTLLYPGVTLPEKIALKSMGKSDLSTGEAKVIVTSDFGDLALDAHFENNVVYSDILVNSFEVGKVLQDSVYGHLNLRSNIEAEMAKNSLQRLSARTNVHSFHYNRYSYQNGTIQIDWSGEETKLLAVLEDSSITAKVDGSIVSLNSMKHVNFSLDVDTVNLHKLNFVDTFFAVSGQAVLDLDVISKDDFKGLITTRNINLHKQDNDFYIESIRFNSDINPDYTNFTFQSEFLDATLTGNTKLAEIKDAIVDHLDLYITLPDSIVNKKDFEFELNLDLKEPSIITDFIVEDLNDIEIDKFNIKYKDRQDFLAMDVQIPKIDYNNIIMDQLNFTIDSKGETAASKLELASLVYDTLYIRKITFDALFEMDQAHFNMSIRDPNDHIKYQLASKLIYSDSIYQLSIDPDQIIINSSKWNISENNYLRYENDQFFSSNTYLQNGEQIFSLTSGWDHIELNLQKFQLMNITRILQNDSIENLVGGAVDGRILLTDPLRTWQFHTNLEIPELKVLSEYIGSAEAEFDLGKNTDDKFDVTVQNHENFIHFAGATTGQKKQLNMILESDIRNAATFQPLVKEYIDDLSGQLKGRLSITERPDDLGVNGSFNFTDLNTTISATNSQLTCNGQLTIDDDLVTFKSFTITDSLHHPFSIAGTIDLQYLYDPHYNLTLKTDDFRAINNPSATDQVVYGKLNFGLKTDITGRQSGLVIDSEISINDKTDITYVMPGQDLELITDEDIVKFMDFENPTIQQTEKSQSQFIADSLISLVKGIDLQTNLTVDPNAKFTVLVDPSSGDYSKFQIGGTLVYRYNDRQRGVLNGIIELKNGFYELSFYGLVKKQFVFDPGSTVTWSGEVMEGDVNFSARHTVKTNSVGLVSNEISSYERAMYNQRLPYDVILKIHDKISSPTITFEIDLPSRNRNSYPTLDSKLNILNQPSMESERNKQVFALLVGGTFIPENPDVSEGSSSSNFATTAARNSVNSIMTQQLNKLTGQIIQGFDVDLGVNTFDDYSGGNAQTRTQLDVKVSKNLFNDRVSAEMESHIDLEGSNKQVAGQSTAGMTEFAVSYKLTENGRYRIKAFRENAYDIYDGEIQNAGVAFIFIREFDRFRKNTKSEQLETEKEKEQKNDQ